MIRVFTLSTFVLALAVAGASPALAVADTFLVYTEAGIPDNGTDIFTWCDAGQPCDTLELTECDNPEGGRNLRTNTNVWAGWGVFLDIVAGTPQPRDLSGYANADMKFFVKTPFDLKIEFQCRPATSDVTYTTFITQHGWDGTNTWQEITIPIADFFAPDPVDMTCMSTVISPFMSTIENLPFFNTFRVDNVRWELPTAHSGPTSVQVSGRELLVNGEPFVVNGVAYNPISICENNFGALQRDRADRYNVDFPLMADLGINTVRLYSTFLTTAMLDAAQAEGLYVIPTFQVDTKQLECAAGKSHMQDRFVETVNRWKDHPAILGWLVGNEVNANPGAADLCTDWYPQVDAMALAAHNAEGPSFHPVGTANSDVGGLGDICQTGCSDDTAMPNLDFWGVQTYRGCQLNGVFNDYGQKTDCGKPLIVTEFGVDAWDSLSGPTGAENETMQADCLQTMLSDADLDLAVRSSGGVSAGQVIFEWTDEWWKAECHPTTDWCNHDNCESWNQPAYPDPSIQEEYWGLAGQSAADPAVRNLRTASSRVSDFWNLGAVCNVVVDSFDPSTGNTTVSFDPAAGSTDHTLYFGPLSDVSTYNYTGSVSGLGANGASALTLPAGDLFFVVAGRNNAEEGCYGLDSAGIERPASSGSSLPQSVNRTCTCP
jgi:hypothetical protein